MTEKKPTKWDLSGGATLTCRQCGAENPTTAYCCLSCFTVLRPKVKPSFWQFSVRPSLAVVTIIGLFLYGGFIVTKRWIDSVEARVQMDLRTAQYNISVVADKKAEPLAADESSTVTEPSQN